MSPEEKKFGLYNTVLRFLVYKITENLKRIYLDIDLDRSNMILTAYYGNTPSELELELFDDIVTNTHAHIPYFYIDQEVKLLRDIQRGEKHDYIIFATHDQLG
ncbi:hypothetical protein WBJ53_24110 [Spirosoma sp. SC4-14]|uniref:hypothetical protein n=1 Tax=Spirosoma sp. SC4-14 TaxID=3128900 RepID=UPI0030CA9516